MPEDPGAAPAAGGAWMVRGGTVITPEGEIPEGAVQGRGSHIEWVGPAAAAPTGARLLWEAPEGYVCPGFLDLHVHGGGGADVMDGSLASLDTMARTHAQRGTTGFLATTMTASRDELLAAARAIREAHEGGTQGAAVLGLHLEGPYINPQRAGAQDPALMRPPDLEEMAALWEILGPAWRLVTLAPELPGAREAVRWLRARGVTVSMGHTDASYEQATAGIEAGVTHVTHCFNGMRGLHHREPGVAGAALSDSRVRAELIADLLHVHPGAMRVLLAAKGTAGIVLVTDGVRAMGMPAGDYTLGGLDITVRDGAVRLTGQDTLAGSVLTMEGAVRNAVEILGLPVAAAVTMATLNPAAQVGLDHRKGKLAPGMDADLVVLDASLQVVLTMVGGRIVYEGTAQATEESRA